jgi:hypothetical protein
VRRAIEILDMATRMRWLGWLVCPAGVGLQLVRTMPPQAKTWQDCVAAVGSFGFEVTTSLWHWSRVSNPRTVEIGSVS